MYTLSDGRFFELFFADQVFAALVFDAIVQHFYSPVLMSIEIKFVLHALDEVFRASGRGDDSIGNRFT